MNQIVHVCVHVCYISPDKAEAAAQSDCVTVVMLFVNHRPSLMVVEYILFFFFFAFHHVKHLEGFFLFPLTCGLTLPAMAKYDIISLLSVPCTSSANP